jgi:hypothetical protein
VHREFKELLALKVILVQQDHKVYMLLGQLVKQVQLAHRVQQVQKDNVVHRVQQVLLDQLVFKALQVQME